MRPFVVAIRFDGSIATYDTNRGGTSIGRPVNGAKEFCRWMIEDLKALVIIQTGRRREDLVEAWLKENKIPFSMINKSYDHASIKDKSNQIIADVYIGNDNVMLNSLEYNAAVVEITRRRKTYDEIGNDSMKW